MKKIKPSVVLTYTIKPNIYGGICCRLQKVSYIVKNFKNKSPNIEKALYIGDNVVIIGDVKLEKNVNIW